MSTNRYRLLHYAPSDTGRLSRLGHCRNNCKLSGFKQHVLPEHKAVRYGPFIRIPPVPASSVEKLIGPNNFVDG